MEVGPRWFDGFFEADWLDVIALNFPEERAQAQVDFVLDKLSIAAS